MGKAKKVAIGIGVVIGFFVIMIAIGASNNTASETNTSLVAGGSNSNQQQQQPTTTDSYSEITTQNNGQSFTTRKETRNIVTGEVRVDAGGYVVHPFTAPKDGTKLQLTGAFVTYGSDDIKVFVADETLFNQWKDGKRVFYTGNVYYSSGERYVTNGLIHIPEGGSIWNGNGETLYIVFDNTEDSAYSKQVNANIKLTYAKYVSE